MRVLWLFPSVLIAACVGPAPRTSAGSASQPGPFDGSLHPHCVAVLAMAEDPGEASVDLATCGARGEPVTVDGARRSAVPIAEPDAWRDGREWEEYTLVGPVGAEFAVSYLVNGGGSGDFTGLLLLRKDGERLVRVAQLAAGDRCDGGLASARMDRSSIEYSVWLTAPAMLALASPSRSSRDEMDLDGGAMSCVAQARYRWEDGEVRWLSVMLEPEPIPLEFERSRTHQSCFDELFNERLEEGRQLLGPNELDAFAAEFAARCLGDGRADARGAR